MVQVDAKSDIVGELEMLCAGRAAYVVKKAWWAQKMQGDGGLK